MDNKATSLTKQYIIEPKHSAAEDVYKRQVQHIAYQQLQEREKMAHLQERSKRYDYIPTLSLAFNAQYNYMSDKLLSLIHIFAVVAHGGC